MGYVTHGKCPGVPAQNRIKIGLWLRDLTETMLAGIPGDYLSYPCVLVCAKLIRVDG